MGNDIDNNDDDAINGNYSDNIYSINICNYRSSKDYHENDYTNGNSK